MIIKKNEISVGTALAFYIPKAEIPWRNVITELFEIASLMVWNSKDKKEHDERRL